MGNLASWEDSAVFKEAIEEFLGFLAEPSNDGGNSGVELTAAGIEGWIAGGSRTSDEEKLAIAQQDARMLGNDAL